MADLPDYMYQNARTADPAFAPDEHLYRRVPPDLWQADDVDVDSIELPDMSVNREKYGPPESVRLVGDEYKNWGVIGFQVGDIPATIQHLGVYVYSFRPKHVPHRRNYPHSEVRVYEKKVGDSKEETHIGKALMERITPDVQQRWREQLRRKCKIILQADHPSQSS